MMGQQGAMPSVQATNSTDSFARVREFAEATRGLESISDLRRLMGEAVVGFGVEYFLMTHHVDFGRPAPGSIQLSNYPPEFIANERQRGGWRSDPALLACEKTTAGFFWSEIGHIIPLTAGQHERFAGVRRRGLGDGFVVPNHIPGEYSGSVHFVVKTGKVFPRELASAFQSLATFGFETARQLVRCSDGMPIVAPPLTQRQRDCLLLAARGKSDTDIGQLLGISPATVNEHIEAAKRRYCVASRQQAIILALYNSQLTFAEILRGR
jgi:LuxR family transcriptional regulator, quorum-sensing system regulator CciR